MQVKLSKMYDVFQKKFDTVEVKEPTGSMLLLHGEPVEWVFTRERNPVVIENKEAIRAYLEACCDPGVELLCQLNVADFRAVKKALLDFFAWPEPAAQESTTSSTSASSG